ncbi:hypothetical protein PCANC_25455 [Puccinia coronata f. sp. avenae]|uniref:Uncharacterized protein n=1 Tax=Puccinia coronata f. sp. avenae TaxID=200324 RepID=A0A2N5S7T8_9BASI|nr:hypothetical protein PCANC_25455 [Puccinia coronata f. sp. avenae]
MTNNKVKILGTKLPNIYPATKSSSNSALQASLCLSGIKSLKAPGPNSNYLDWEFVLNQFLQATDMDRSSENYGYVRPFCGNAFGMLKALTEAHQDSTSGDNLHSSSLLISLPPDWLNCVSSLMNKERVLSTKIVSALKAKSLRQKAQGDENNPIVVARAEPTTSKQASLADDPSQLF